MVAGRSEFRLAHHAVDLFAHALESSIDAGAFGLDVIGDGVLDDNPWLVEHCKSLRHALDQLLPGRPRWTTFALARFAD
jgi:hypothetical protein